MRGRELSGSLSRAWTAARVMRARSAPLMLLLAMTFGQAAAYMTSPPAVTSRGCQVSTNRAAFMAGFGKKVEKKEKTFDGKKTFEKHMMQYDELRVDGYPPPNVVDVYVHAKGAEKFWFVGKCCAREGAGLEDGPALAAVRQKRLVFEHAKLLQPRELGGLKGMKPKDLELWCAPPNSEISVAQRMQGLRSLNDMKPVDELTMEDVGFLPERKAPQRRSDGRMIAPFRSVRRSRFPSLASLPVHRIHGGGWQGLPRAPASGRPTEREE